MSETITTLGKLLPDDHGQSRDAVHVAVMPVVAGEDGLSPGEKLRLVYGSANMVVSGEYNDDYIGVVDPFLGEWHIEKGQRFWMWLRPGTITGLRHEWTHPVLDGRPGPVSESEAWLRRFADKWNFDYADMIASAVARNGYITARGRDLHCADELDPGDEALFWHHIQALTGKQLGEAHRRAFGWSCTC